jgi:multiple sugar transport system substrate-binding protein
MKPLRSLVLRILALASLIAVLAGSAVTQHATHAAGSITLTFWESTNPQEQAFTKPAVQQWNKQHSDIQIKLQDIPAGNSTEEVYAAAIAAHKTPDITNNLLPAVVPQYSSEGGLYQMDKLPDFISYMTARMPKGTLDQFKSGDGHYYQIPWKANPVMFIYRTDLFKKAGITSFPRTYSQFLAALQALKNKTNVNPIFPTIDTTWWQRFFDFYPFYLAQSGGTMLLNSKANGAIFQDHGAAQVMTFWRQIFAQQLTPKSSATADKWAVNKEAMYLAGPWGPNGEIYQHNAGNIPWGVAPIPVPDSMAKSAPAYPYTYSDPKNITIFASTKYPQQAWQFIKYYINAQNDAKLLQTTWEFPYRAQLIANPTKYSPALFTKYPQLAQFAKQLPHTSGLDNSPKFQQVFDNVSQAWGSAVINGSKSPQAAVKSAASAVDGVVAGGNNSP